MVSGVVGMNRVFVFALSSVAVETSTHVAVAIGHYALSHRSLGPALHGFGTTQHPVRLSSFLFSYSAGPCWLALSASLRLQLAELPGLSFVCAPVVSSLVQRCVLANPETNRPRTYRRAS
jgi:hypothetical protein